MHRIGFVVGLDHAGHRRLRAVRHVHDDAEPVHPPHRLGAERGQAAMHRRGGLDVAGLVDQVMRKLDRAHTAGLQRVQPVEVALQEIAALDGEHQGRIPLADVGRLARDSHARWPRRCPDIHPRRPGTRQAPDRAPFPAAASSGRAGSSADRRWRKPRRPRRRPGPWWPGRSIDRADAVGAAGMGMHVDDHGWQANSRSCRFWPLRIGLASGHAGCAS